MSVKTVEFKPFSDQKPGTYVNNPSSGCPANQTIGAHRRSRVQASCSCRPRTNEPVALVSGRRSRFSSSLTTAKPSLLASSSRFPRALRVSIFPAAQLIHKMVY